MVLGIPFGFVSFSSSFLQDVLDEDVRHANLFSRSEDVQVAFKILFHCLVQKLSRLLCGFLPLPSFQH
jgi:hypothetical protein